MITFRRGSPRGSQCGARDRRPQGPKRKTFRATRSSGTTRPAKSSTRFGPKAASSSSKPGMPLVFDLKALQTLQFEETVRLELEATL